MSGIGKAYSDEILHRVKLSPVKMTQRLDKEELERLFVSIKDTLNFCTDHLRTHYGDNFAEKVAAFGEGMAAHERYGTPCPKCQTEGKHLMKNLDKVCQDENSVSAQVG